MECYSDGVHQTFKDVEHHLGSLGQRRKVFIWFISSKHTADDKTHNLGTLEDRILLFSRHLITYGFEVTVDLSTAGVNHTSETDWAAWTDREMLQADWIICICSHSLYALLHNASNPVKIHSSNTKATYLYKALYNRLLNDTTSKVIPVILQQEDDNILFVPPTLRDPKSILRIFEDTPFYVKKLSGDLERLICCMAGINRTSLRDTEQNHHHQGFIKLPSKIPQS